MHKLFAASLMAAFSFSANAATVLWDETTAQGDAGDDYSGATVLNLASGTNTIEGTRLLDSICSVCEDDHDWFILNLQDGYAITSIILTTESFAQSAPANAAFYWNLFETSSDTPMLGSARETIVSGNYSVDSQMSPGFPLFSDRYVLEGRQISRFGPGSTETNYRIEIGVSAVPVPAAVWLFGSALAGLGWLRRKPTA